MPKTAAGCPLRWQSQLRTASQVKDSGTCLQAGPRQQLGPHLNTQHSSSTPAELWKQPPPFPASHSSCRLLDQEVPPSKAARPHLHFVAHGL